MSHEDPEVDHDDGDDEEEDQTLRNSAVIEKYKMAGTISNNAVKEVLKLIKPGAKVLDLAMAGDKSMLEQTEKVFNNKKGDDKVEKGVAFPCCIGVNGIVCHYAPVEEDATPPLKSGDVVKIDLATHIDGFCAPVAHTVIVTDDGVGDAGENEKTNVVFAAAEALDKITHCFRPGAKNQDITNTLGMIAKDFDVTPVEGVLLHEMKRYIIDGSEVIAGRHVPEQRVLDTELTEYQVWCVDICWTSAPQSTGDKGGKLRCAEDRPLIYKRALDQNYQLKMKASREVFGEINKRFQTFPFAMRHLDPKKGRFCISECLKHDLVAPFPVLESKKEEHAAHFKGTVLITANSIQRISGWGPDTLPLQTMKCDKKIETKEAKDACARSLQLKKKGGNKKKKKKGDGKGDAADGEE